MAHSKPSSASGEPQPIVGEVVEPTEAFRLWQRTGRRLGFFGLDATRYRVEPDWIHEILRREPYVYLGDADVGSECFWCEGITRHNAGCVYATAVRVGQEGLGLAKRKSEWIDDVRMLVAAMEDGYLNGRFTEELAEAFERVRDLLGGGGE